MLIKIKNAVTALLFCFALLAGALAMLLTPDEAVSRAERRYLAERPPLSLRRMTGGDYFVRWDKYFTDRFVPRETLRSLKARTLLYAFNRLDYNGVYLYGGHAAQIEYPLREEMARYFAEAVNRLREMLPDSARVYYSVIPDKGYYLAEQAGRPALDYDRMLEILAAQLADIAYIDIFHALSADCYYATDPHWKQETLSAVTAALAEGMGLTENPFPQKFETAEFSPFYGSYSGRLALPLEPDVITYLKTELFDNAQVSHIESGKARSVYDESGLSGLDAYDVFLSGATAVCTLTNTAGGTGRELVMFRDSFAGPLAPLLLAAYDKITLIDTRYISPGQLAQYVDFTSENLDVLFLYSAGLVNNSGTLRR